MSDISVSEIIGRCLENGAELEGDATALRGLAASLRSQEPPPPITLTVPADASRPDVTYLMAVLVEHDGSEIRIELKEQLLRLCGGVEKLGRLAESIERFASGPDNEADSSFLFETLREENSSGSASTLELVIIKTRT